jgi:hypothetical protein
MKTFNEQSNVNINININSETQYSVTLMKSKLINTECEKLVAAKCNEPTEVDEEEVSFGFVLGYN